MSKRVEYQESSSVAVRRFLQSKGFGTNDREGYVEVYENIPNAGLLLRFKQAVIGRTWFGTIHFYHARYGADEKNWVFAVFGRQYLEMVKELAEGMTSAFGVKITVRLQDEQPRREGEDNGSWA